jgi:hypothetical protein
MEAADAEDVRLRWSGQAVIRGEMRCVGRGYKICGLVSDSRRDMRAGRD